MDFKFFVLLTSIGGILILLAVKFLLRLRKLPPGPFPIPIIGSLYALSNDSGYEVQFVKWSKKYGDIMTIWLGSTPVIVFNNWKLIHQAFTVKRNDFTDILKTKSLQIMTGKRKGITSENGEAWEVLRRVATIIVRRYYGSSKLLENAKWGIERGLKEQLVIGHPFDPSDLMYAIMQNVHFAILIGKREADDQDITNMKQIQVFIREGFSENVWSDFVPIYRIFNRKRLKNYEDAIEMFIKMLKDNLKEHERTFKKEDIRDLTDAILASKEQYEEEMKSSAALFTEDNIVQVMLELYQAGADLNSIAILWFAKIIAYEPDIQEKMFHEISEAVGDEDLTQDCKEKCPYTVATIMETLRMSNMASSAFIKQATVDTELGGYQIPKGGAVHFNLCAPNMDSSLWPEPDRFRPERYLDEVTGGVAKIQFPGYYPFGIGKRTCLGERLAMMHMFLAVAYLVRRFRFLLPKGQEKVLNITSEPMLYLGYPKPFKIVLEERDAH